MVLIMERFVLILTTAFESRWIILPGGGAGKSRAPIGMQLRYQAKLAEKLGVNGLHCFERNFEILSQIYQDLSVMGPVAFYLLTFLLMH